MSGNLIENVYRDGCMIAIVISWSVNRSVIWAILHGAFSWLYIFYYEITRKD